MRLINLTPGKGGRLLLGALPFVVLADHRPAAASGPLDKVMAMAKAPPVQAALF